MYLLLAKKGGIHWACMPQEDNLDVYEVHTL
jgi:hypothetical protein